MISTRHFAVLRHVANLANHVNKIVNVNYASNYCKIDESIFGLNNEQREVSKIVTEIFYAFIACCVISS